MITLFIRHGAPPENEPYKEQASFWDPRHEDANPMTEQCRQVEAHGMHIFKIKHIEDLYLKQRRATYLLEGEMARQELNWHQNLHYQRGAGRAWEWEGLRGGGYMYIYIYLIIYIY